MISYIKDKFKAEEVEITERGDLGYYLVVICLTANGRRKRIVNRKLDIFSYSGAVRQAYTWAQGSKPLKRQGERYREVVKTCG